MPHQPSATQIRLENITLCLSATTNTLAMLSDHLDAPFLVAISNTTQSLVKCAQNAKQNKNECTQLLEHAYQLLTAIIALHIGSDTAGDFPPSVLSHIGKFTETLHKIHTFVEAQQSGSKLKKFFHQGEMNTLFRDCKIGLQQALEFFQVKTAEIMTDVAKMQQEAQERHQEVLKMIEALSDGASSDRASSVRGSTL
ncbi:hypothetical protein B0H19DRAFT_1078974 [Mycena capillaripes]|nr:hypothetical protein B0H19DRAFT_1078974 [Mycena capillaripes]